MSTGAQIEAEWGALDVPTNVAGASDAAGGPAGGPRRFVTDEEILGIDPPSPNNGYSGLARQNAIMREGSEETPVSQELPRKDTPPD